MTNLKLVSLFIVCVFEERMGSIYILGRELKKSLMEAFCDGRIWGEWEWKEKNPRLKRDRIIAEYCFSISMFSLNAWNYWNDLRETCAELSFLLISHLDGTVKWNFAYPTNRQFLQGSCDVQVLWYRLVLFGYGLRYPQSSHVSCPVPGEQHPWINRAKSPLIHLHLGHRRLNAARSSTSGWQVKLQRATDSRWASIIIVLFVGPGRTRSTSCELLLGRYIEKYPSKLHISKKQFFHAPNLKVEIEK